MGVNRIVFHTSDQQPFVDDAHKPGITLWMFGQHYTRNITWAEQAVAWNTYLARSSYLLQTGQFVADLAYFYGEGAPATVSFWKDVRPAPAAGYSYDYLNADVLLNSMSVANGRLVLPSGMSYRALVLPEDVDQLPLPVLRKIRALAQAGGIIIAPKPVKSPSLADGPSSEVEVRNIANEVWGGIDGKSITENACGKGKVYWGRMVQEILDVEKISPPAEYKFENGRTVVPLRLEPNASVFVVFRRAATVPSRTLPHPVNTQLAAVDGPWQVMFPPNWGAPPQVTLDKLVSWTASPDEGVKYFSGTATYSKDIQTPKDWFRPGSKIVLDLGTVKEMAELSINGKPVGGILWKPPFQADVTGLLKAGSNHVEIKVTNLWPNRIIGDQQPSVQKKYTWTDYRPYTKDSPLLESGLIGPVTVTSVSLK